MKGEKRVRQTAITLVIVIILIYALRNIIGMIRTIKKHKIIRHSYIFVFQDKVNRTNPKQGALATPLLILNIRTVHSG